MWSNVIGQERIKRVLKAVLERDMLPGSYLFLGPEGTGKDAAAFELAKAINCLDPKTNGAEACDACVNCLSIDQLSAPFLHFVHARPSPKTGSSDPNDITAEELDSIREQFEVLRADKYHNLSIPKANVISVFQIRELRLALSKSLATGKRRTVIISEADRMNGQAQNALLKTLEEPHANTIIILTSSNPHRLYPTILSRCQEVRFDVLSNDEISDALVERDEISREESEFLARLAAGSYSQARTMVGEDIRAMRNEIVAFLRMGLSKSRRNAIKEIDVFVPRSGGGSFLEKRVAVEQRLTLLGLWLRDALALTTGSHEQIINIDQRTDLDRFVSRFNDEGKIIKAIRAVEQAQSQTRQQLQLRPVMINLVMELEAALL
jgi:DNA polymerase-3 subunit delta'